MLSLLRVGAIHAPEPVAGHDILVAGRHIVAIGESLDIPASWPIEIHEFPDAVAVPGFIDQHAHITGGGGEGGCGTRCTPITVPDIVQAGITTIVGLLGTDSISRSPADLLGKARELQAAGINAWMYTGAYRVPPPTLTGDVQRDLAWIPEVLGVGEIAISDHRSSQPTDAEIARIVADARVGGMLGGKLGICHFHLGDGRRGLEPLKRLLHETEIPARQVIPTHVNRNPVLLEEAVSYALGFDAAIDVTAFEMPDSSAIGAADAVRQLVAAGVPASHITVSSDCNGSLPDFDEAGNMIGIRTASNKPLIEAWKTLARDDGLSFADALAMFTHNVATVLGIDGITGSLAVGKDADITVLDKNLVPQAVFARGRQLL